LATAEPVAELVADYEHLRKDALSLRFASTNAAGLALFLRSGMIAWMRARPACVHVQTKEPITTQSTLDCSLEIQFQIATIVAGMILSQPWEASQ
jgi:hypothetical protein